MKEQPSICFVAHNAYGVLANVDIGHAGGVEVQIPLLARWFARQGYQVSMVTWDEGFDDGTEIDGIKVYRLCRRNDGLPIVRFFHPRWSSLLSALHRANADIYYYSCGDLALGQIALWAKRNNKKLIHSIVNEADCARSLAGLPTLRERILYKTGLKKADATITQTQRQKQLLLSEFGVDSVVIPMPSKGFAAPEHKPGAPTDEHNYNILWVGRFSKEKRLEWLLQAAQQLTEFHFDVIGAANQENEYSRSLLKLAEGLPNVTLHGRVKHEDLGNFYQRARLLCSTSIYEGFPNIFLESWSMGVPLISTFDPDNVIRNHHLGRIASSVNELVAAIRDCSKNEEWDKLHASAKAYFQNNHTIEHCMPMYQSVVDSLAGNQATCEPVSTINSL